MLRGACQGGHVKGGAYSFVACLSHLAIDHTPLSRGSTVPTPNNRDTSNIWAIITLPYIMGGEWSCIGLARRMATPIPGRSVI